MTLEYVPASMSQLAEEPCLTTMEIANMMQVIQLQQVAIKSMDHNYRCILNLRRLSTERLRYNSHMDKVHPSSKVTSTPLYQGFSLAW